MGVSEFLARVVQRKADNFFKCNPDVKPMCSDCAFKAGTDSNINYLPKNTDLFINPNLVFFCHKKLEDNSYRPLKKICTGFQILKSEL